jgi:hypothetical protein
MLEGVCLVADGDGKRSLCGPSKVHWTLGIGHNEARLANDRTTIATVRSIPVGSWGGVILLRTGIPHHVVPLRQSGALKERRRR